MDFRIRPKGQARRAAVGNRGRRRRADPTLREMAFEKYYRRKYLHCIPAFDIENEDEQDPGSDRGSISGRLNFARLTSNLSPNH